VPIGGTGRSDRERGFSRGIRNWVGGQGLITLVDGHAKVRSNSHHSVVGFCQPETKLERIVRVLSVSVVIKRQKPFTTETLRNEKS